MEQSYDSDVRILEEEEPAESPAGQEEQNLFGCGGTDIFEQDDPAPSPQPSLYGMSQLLADVNVPTQEEDPEDIPPCSPATEAALQSAHLDWNEEVEREAPFSPALEEVVEVGRFHDPCLPFLPAERIPLDQRCSRQRFEQDDPAPAPQPSLCGIS